MQKITKLLNTEYTRNFFKLFSSLLLAQGLSFALSPLLSRLYTPEDFGLVALYMAIAGLLSMVATGKYEQAIMLPGKKKEAVAILKLVLILSLAFSAFCVIILLFFGHHILQYTPASPLGSWIWLLPLSIMMHGIYQGFNYMANRMKYFGNMATTNLIQHLGINITRIAIGWTKYAWNGLIIAQLVAPVFSATFLVRKIFPTIKTEYAETSESLIRQQALKYSQYPTYNLIQSVTNNLASSLPIFMFTSGFSAQTAGLYAFGYTFVFRPLSLFSQSTLQVLSQKVIEDYHSGKDIYPGIKRLVLQFFNLGIIPFIILGIFAPYIFSFVFSSTWTEAGRMIQILIPWLFMVYLTSPLSFIPELFFKQKISMFIDFISIALRFSALYTGIYFNDVYLALALFSAVSFLVVGLSLLWYLHMARNHKKMLHSQP